MASIDKPGSVQHEALTEEEQENTAVDEAELNLLTMESIDRSSPELWPEKYPGVSDFMSSYTPANIGKCPYSKEFTEEDKQQIKQLSTLPTGNLILKVKELHDLAYQLGVEESKEMTRGKYLNIFSRASKKINK